MSDLRQFRHFVALAEHGHYARAAEAVNLSQPALSRSIQALEGQLVAPWWSAAAAAWPSRPTAGWCWNTLGACWPGIAHCTTR